MFSDSVVLILGKFFSSFLGLLAGIILARSLGAANLGQYQIFLSAQTIAITLLTFGVGNSSILFINQDLIEEKEIVSSFLPIFFGIALFCSTCLFIIINSFNVYFGTLNNFSIICFLIGTGSLIILSVLRPILYARRKVYQVSILTTLPTFVLVIGIVLYEFLGILNVGNVLSIWGLGNFLVLLLSLYFHRSNISFDIKLNWPNIFKVSQYGIKLSASNLLLVIIANTSVFFIQYFSGKDFDQVGLFSRSIAISSLALLIPSAVGPLLFSRWSEIRNREIFKLEVEKALRIFTSMSLIIITISIVFSKYIIYFLYGKEYLSIQISLIILIISLLFQCMSEVLNNYLASQGKAILTFYSLVNAFIILLVGNFLLIPQFQINGAAIAVLLCAVTNSICLFYYVNKEININLLNSVLVRRKDLNLKII